MKEVRIGERNVTIPRFSAFKIARSGRLISQIAKAYPTIMFDVAKFERDYEEQNTIRITKTMAQLPRFDSLALTDEDFEGREFVELPRSPSNGQMFASVFPQIMEAAEGDVITLFALVLAPNKELEEADENDGIDEYLKTSARKLLHEAFADQLLDAAIVVAQVLAEQFAGKIDEAGKAAASLQDQVTGAKSTNSPESSTDSPTPTDGTETE